MPRLLHLMAGTNHVLPAAELLTSRGWSVVAKGRDRDREKLVVEVLARKLIGKLEVHILVGVVCRWGLDGWAMVDLELRGLHPADGLVQFETGTVWSLEQLAVGLVGLRFDLNSMVVNLNQEVLCCVCRQPMGEPGTPVVRRWSRGEVCSENCRGKLTPVTQIRVPIQLCGARSSAVVLDGSEPAIQWCPVCGQDLVLKETGVNGLWYRWYRCPGCDWSVNFAVRYQKEGES